MLELNEYARVMQKFYGKSLILESPSEFHPVLYFYFIDALAHIDFTLGIQAYNYMSPRNIMNMEYMRWRVDEEKVGERAHFPDFINWLKDEHPEVFGELPMLWTGVYDRDDPAQYRSFRIVLNPDDRKPIPAEYLSMFIDEFFDREFLKQLYKTSTLARLFDEFVESRTA
ncbi:MAG TPA: hypothetical protein PKK74_09970 [Candidatus Methanoculleus thermohydrogenotrophicum]|jgi:hypothetical protein|nr:hypothetical protein [Candidatus Methanoculleus thermohydrogenotrophicum]NLM82853.1 hypothetical protein [Candidatus Methanoculleus thermohydrogenotrophicum]HOB18995.1 hypothetical protein [Candidatus Methanoculleus thermohydrogenotrophicum]HPZ39031.1 hypothetical protein [Candidatus Methanoculleus thermohydrogenotrophicum]HQC92156.1 hypothetical protein [Candidatus Methanoculleus thermohydrogenotrophicum]